MKRLAVISLLLAASPVLALPPLSTVTALNDDLRALFIADQIRIGCPTIEANMVKGWAFAYSIERRAREMGYSREEIKDFVESKKERKRLEGETAAYLKANGVRGGQPETYCRLGREEIAKGSQIGAFLRAK